MAGSTFISAIINQTDFYFIMLAGAIVNSLQGKLLKILIGTKRPGHSKKKSYGMPSSHANSLFFFVSYLTMNAASHHSVFIAVVVFIVTVMYSSLVCYYRVFVSKDHTVPQIVAGAVHGSMMGAACYTVALPWYSMHKTELRVF